MSYILCIETAADICSVSLISKNDLVVYKEIEETNAHSRYLTVLIEQVFMESGISAKELSAVALSKGPGSYTGLRIGASVAKGLCYVSPCPLIAIDTLEIVARALTPDIVSKGDLIIPMMDARRMEVYFEVLNDRFEIVKDAEPLILDSKSFSEYLDKSVLHFVGNGAEKFKDICGHKNAVFHGDNFFLTARSMSVPAIRDFEVKNFTDYVYFEPTYLKPVMATKPKKKWF